jgi:hypothetical protein
MTERQITRMMVRETFIMFLYALLHMFEAHLAPIRAYLPSRRQLFGGHPPVAVVFAGGFGLVLGMNIGLAGAYAAAVVIGIA